MLFRETTRQHEQSLTPPASESNYVFNLFNIYVFIRLSWRWLLKSRTKWDREAVRARLETREKSTSDPVKKSTRAAADAVNHVATSWFIFWTIWSQYTTLSRSSENIYSQRFGKRLSIFGSWTQQEILHSSLTMTHR